jgi:uncharacterized lipoprotein YddW (UPF0748 family)
MMAAKTLTRLICLLALGVNLTLNTATAQVGVSLELTNGQRLEVTAKDANRNDHAVVLFTPSFGDTTRTNPYGVEAIAVRDGKDPARYRVTRLTSVWECEKEQNGLRNCGNAEIPKDGLVLSATGDKRQALLSHLQPGQTFRLNESWFENTSFPLSVINPTVENNPAGRGYPGYRASNQLIVYDARYGSPRTETNEFGFEVTVEDGVVVAHEGSDSLIPKRNGYVISGHGRARNWLIAHAPLGAHIQLDPETKQLTSVVDLKTYVYQLEKRFQETERHLPRRTKRDMKQALKKIEQLQRRGGVEEATQLAVNSLESLNRTIWETSPVFPQNTIRGAWHRPVEKTGAEIGRTLDMLQRAGLNTVFLETFFHGYTIFPSQTFAQYGLTQQNPKFAGVDLLQLWLDEAAQRDMKIHVWFQDFYVGNRAFDPPGPILSKYPQWTNVQYSALEKAGPTPSTLETGGYFLDPANPEARLFLMKLIDEVVTRYPVDGFQLDYIRYPSSFPPDRFSYLKTTWGYTPVARQAFLAQHGVDPAELTPDQTDLWAAWNQFKAEQVNTFVRDASAQIRKARPSVQISAAVFPKPEESLVQKHQDWGTWIDQGWVDFLAPMTLTSAEKVVEADARRLAERSGGKVKVMAGVFGPFNQNSAEHVLLQIGAAKRGGADGVVLFDTAHLSGRMIQALSVSHRQSAEKK